MINPQLAEQTSQGESEDKGMVTFEWNKPDDKRESFEIPAAWADLSPDEIFNQIKGESVVNPILSLEALDALVHSPGTTDYTRYKALVSYSNAINAAQLGEAAEGKDALAQSGDEFEKIIMALGLPFELGEEIITDERIHKPGDTKETTRLLDALHRDEQASLEKLAALKEEYSKRKDAKGIAIYQQILDAMVKYKIRSKAAKQEDAELEAV